MPLHIVAAEPVPLRERQCQLKGCHKVFYLCKRCDHGRLYCSSECSAQARRLNHRIASARYQRTEYGRQAHCDYQKAYRERLRARSATPPLTDPTINFSESRRSYGSAQFRSVSQPQRRRPRRLFLPLLRSLPWIGLRSCQFCGRLGYFQKGGPYEPAAPGSQP